jgi:sec1 family domain-containing protein 1
MRKENTYWALNSARTKDEELDYVIDRIVSGLFSVMVTMGKAFSREIHKG